MHEVISFANSQSAGHLLAQLYNVQESHLAYTKEKKLTHSNNVFLAPTKVNGRTNYYPRTLNVEFSGGYGFLGKYEYHEKSTDVSDLAELYGGVVMEKQPKPDKNEYQKCLDAGKKPDRSMLTDSNTQCWTSYNKLIYRPSSLLELLEFNHPDGCNKRFPRLRFDDFPVGQTAYKDVQYDVDDTLRRNLEALDNIQGINFVTELNNAWGGFTNELVVDVKDEYFNNGANSKHNLWSYGLFSPNVGTKNILTEIRSFVGLANSSTLFVPIIVPSACAGFFNANYDSSNLWHRGAVLSLLVNSIWGLNCQESLPIRMAEIEAELLRGFSKRTIVNEIEISAKKPPAQFGIVQDVNIMDYYSNPEKITAPTSDSNKLSLGVSNIGGSQQLSSALIGDASSENATFINNHIQEVVEQDSFPQILDKVSDFSVSMRQSTAIRHKLKEYKKIVSRVRLPHHLEIIGEKGDFIEEISALIEEYTVGYSDESDSDD